MASDFQVTGADDFLRVSKALKAAGQAEIRKELNKGLRDGAKPLIPKTRAAARSRLPKAGGFAEAVAKTPQRVQVRTGQKTAGVRVVVAKRRGSGAAAANKGKIRHPVFGQDVFVEQKVDAGWFDQTLEKEGPSVLPELERVIGDMAKRIARKGK